MKRTIRVLRGAVCWLLFCTALSASAQLRFAVTAYTDRGGGTSSGGAFAVAGTEGQSDAGTTTGGRFAVSSGFWPTVEESLPRLAIQRQGNQVILSWPSPSTGFVLQQTSALNANGTGWALVGAVPSAVNGRQEVSLTIGAGSRGFRLCRP